MLHETETILAKRCVSEQLPIGAVRTMTELTKPVSRKIHLAGKGDFVVTITEEGISLRKSHKQITVMLPYEQLALRALEQDGWMLSAKEWSDPLKTLGKLAGRRKKRA